MKKILALLVLLTLSLMLSTGAFAQSPLPVTSTDIKPIVTTGAGAIDQQTLQNFRSQNISKDKINAASGTDLKQLTEDRDVLSKHNTMYSNTVKVGKVQDQKHSGRCWLFAALNMVRNSIAKKYNTPDIELSQNYLSFWDKMEKANFFLEIVIASADRDLHDRELKYFLKDPVQDGGYWNSAVVLINKYGIVPKYAMAETAQSENTDTMNAVLYSLLRKDAKTLRDMHAKGSSTEEMRAEKEKMLGQVYSFLVMSLGEPPQKFSFRVEDKDKKVSNEKIFTPTEFLKDSGIDLSNYICLLNVPCWAYNKTYEVVNLRNIIETPDMKMLNVDMGAMKEATKKSILAGEPVWFSSDVRDMDKIAGIMSDRIFDYSAFTGIDFKTTKADRILYYDTVDAHAMLITGVDIINGNAVKWQVENSWGDKRGSEGFYSMYDKWFDENVFQVVVNKKYITKEQIELFNQPATLVPESDLLQ